MQLTKSLIEAAMHQPGFDDWRPPFDVPHLVRPRQRPVERPGEGRQAAVMLLLYRPEIFAGGASDLHLVLTRRHENLNKHAGQISLPGGRQDPGETPERAALRETAEEIGVAPEAVQVLGRLNTIYIPPSDFTVFPFVGWIDSRPEFVPADAEVAEIIEVPMSLLLKPETLVTGPVKTAGGMKLEVPYYQVEDHKVWGATAMMLGELIERVHRVGDSVSR